MRSILRVCLTLFLPCGARPSMGRAPLRVHSACVGGGSYLRSRAMAMAMSAGALRKMTKGRGCSRVQFSRIDKLWRRTKWYEKG